MSPVILANLMEYRQGLAAQSGTAGLQAQPEYWEHLRAGEDQKKLFLSPKLAMQEEVSPQCVQSTDTSKQKNSQIQLVLRVKNFF